jgi:hypothetical protein
MAWEPFLGPRLKVERADRHIADVNSVVRKFLEREPYTAIVEQEKGCPDALVLRAKEKLPNRLAAIVGDAVHNLRTALDYLAVDLVALNSQSTKGVYFPFCESADGLEAMIKERHVDRASEKVVNEIRLLKPYRGGNDALRAIHDLDIIDKHKLLMPIGYIGGVENLMYSAKTDPNKININIFGDNFWRGALDDGAKMVTLAAGHDLKIGQQFKAEIQIAFADGQPFEGKPIIQSLKIFSEVVTSVIARFERLCLGA